MIPQKQVTEQRKEAKQISKDYDEEIFQGSHHVAGLEVPIRIVDDEYVCGDRKDISKMKMKPSDMYEYIEKMLLYQWKVQ